MSRIAILILMLAFVPLAGCTSAQKHSKAVSEAGQASLTTGVVQKEIHKGMNQADVIAALGSPNLVTKDSDGRETYIWDKIHTDTVYSKGRAGASILILGGFSEAGAQTVSQSTLTVIIKFTEGVVDEFSYHSSRF